jgi:hypothetical protein
MVAFHTGTGIILGGVTKTVQQTNGRLLDVFEYRPPKPMKIHAGGRCEDGKEIAGCPFRANEAEPQFNIRVSFNIAFDESTPAKGQPAAKCLRNLYDFVRDEVLTPFEPIFSK